MNSTTHTLVKSNGSNKRQENPFAAITDTMPTISVVVPTLNEAKNIPHVLPLIPEWVHEVIIVDAHSTDGTIEAALKIRPDVRIVFQEGRGKGDALRAGFTAAAGDIIVMIDADGSTDPREIPAFVTALLTTDADFAKGSRFVQGGGTEDMSLFRRLGNWGFVQMVRVMFGGAYSDLCYGYNAFWARVLPLLDLDGDGFEIETMMNVRAIQAGLKIVEVPSFEADRIYGTSNLKAIPDGWRVLKTIFKEWLRKPGLRAMKRLQRASGESFKGAVHLLLREAQHLYHNRAMMTEEAYQSAMAALKAAYKDLLEFESDSPTDRELQQRYRRFYGNGQLWAFLEPEDEEAEEEASEAVFKSSMQLLFSEAQYLYQNRDQLPTNSYHRALETLRASYDTLLNLETNSPDDQRIQKRYSEHYTSDRIWAFLEMDSGLMRAG